MNFTFYDVMINIWEVCAFIIHSVSFVKIANLPAIYHNENTALVDGSSCICSLDMTRRKAYSGTGLPIVVVEIMFSLRFVDSEFSLRFVKSKPQDLSNHAFQVGS